jgi:hypothetical protein
MTKKTKKPSQQPVRRRLSTSDQVRPKTYSRARTMSDVSRARKFRSERNEEQKKARRAKRSRTFLVTCLIISLSAILILTQIHFDAIYVSFNDDTDKVTKQPDFEKMTDLTREYLSRHPFERISFLLNQSGLNQHIVDNMPEIQATNLQKANLFTSSLSISLRHPLASFKGQYVDSEGVVFQNNFYNSPQIEMIDNSGAGESNLSGSFLGFIGQVLSGLNHKNLTVKKIVIPPGALRYVEFYLEGLSYPFKAQIDRQAASQVSDIVNMKKYLESKSITPSYVDVRVEGKGYWR